MKIEDLAISMADDYMRARIAVINSGDTVAGPALDNILMLALRIKYERESLDNGE